MGVEVIPTFEVQGYQDQLKMLSLQNIGQETISFQVITVESVSCLPFSHAEQVPTTILPPLPVS